MDQLAALFAALADRSRLRIIGLLLRTPELCVCDIERTLGFSQTKVSRHMGMLRRAGLVRVRRSGRWMIYSLRRPAAAAAAAVFRAVEESIETTDRSKADRAALTEDIRRGCCVGPTLACEPAGHQQRKPS